MVQIIELIANKKIMDILSFFIRNPTKEFSQIELIKKTKIAKATLVKWLKLLVDENILHLKRIGVTNLYSLNNENMIIKQLKILFTLSDLGQLKQLSKKYESELYIFGSSSRGENVEQSDIDLLIIGKPDKNNLLGEIKKISEKIKREINPQIFSNQEWAMMARKDPSFYERVEKDKVKLE